MATTISSLAASRRRPRGVALLAQISTGRRRHLSDAAMSGPLIGITIP
jgi:hypothetical protein